MFLVFYDVKSGSTPSGLRIQLVRALKKDGGIQVQRSVWLIPMLSEEALRILMKVKALGGSAIFSEFKPFNPLLKQSIPLNVGVILHGSHRVLSPLLNSLKSVLKREKVNVVVKTSGRYMSEEPKPLPSVVADQLCRSGVDAVVFLTHSNYVENGMYMGFEIYENSSLLRCLNVPFSELLYVRDEAKSILISWVKGTGGFLEGFLSRNMNIDVMNGCPVPQRIEAKDGMLYRKVLGVRPGEKLIVDDVTVAKVVADEVILVAKRGRLIDAIGAVPCEAMKKLRKINIHKALVKTM